MRKARNKGKEICGICRGYIILDIDNYCHLEDYKNGKFFTEGFYHNSCYIEALGKGIKHKQIQDMAISLLEKLKGGQNNLITKDV